MQLPPHELWNDLTNTFEALKDACEEPETKKRHWYNWESKRTWLLIKQHTYLRQASFFRQVPSLSRWLVVGRSPGRPPHKEVDSYVTLPKK